jgi:hypothetical protein
MITVILAVVLAGATALAQVAVPPPPQPASESQSNATVLKLLRTGVSERAILHVISAAAGTFDTSADALAALKQAGASEAELSAIASQGAAPANAPPAGAQANSGPSLAETMKYIQMNLASTQPPAGVMCHACILKSLKLSPSIRQADCPSKIL